MTKLKYEPPQAFNLNSILTATGQYRPQCRCQNGCGESSSGECNHGAMPQFEQCHAGGRPHMECHTGSALPYHY
jgi:hypothetical protein